jgi:TPP-dependent pyruvate/acetoin dehydrogenase alpha subunit
VLDRDLARGLLRSMLLIRSFEEKTDELNRSGVIVGDTHSYIGEEAIAAGVIANLEPNDLVFSTHRNHGHCLAKGMEPWRMLAEMLGREGAYCLGLGGDNHQGDIGRRMYGGNNIVGGGMPLATGAAYVQKYRRTGNIVACFFGDGALNQGLFHESLNLAAVLGVPVLFVLENNQYAISTRIEKVTASKLSAAERASAYSLETARVDGNDVVAVHEASRSLVEHVRSSQRPAFLQCDTYRLKSHWTGEWGTYRSREEVDAEWEREPIKRFVDALLADGVLERAEIDALAAEIAAEVLAAVEAASARPQLDWDTVYKAVTS